MERTDTTEQNFRLNFKQTSKGFWYCELTVRADTMDLLKSRFEELKRYALLQLDVMNGEDKK